MSDDAPQTGEVSDDTNEEKTLSLDDEILWYQTIMRQTCGHKVIFHDDEEEEQEKEGCDVRKRQQRQQKQDDETADVNPIVKSGRKRKQTEKSKSELKQKTKTSVQRKRQKTHAKEGEEKDGEPVQAKKEKRLYLKACKRPISEDFKRDPTTLLSSKLQEPDWGFVYPANSDLEAEVQAEIELSMKVDVLVQNECSSVYSLLKKLYANLLEKCEQKEFRRAVHAWWQLVISIVHEPTTTENQKAAEEWADLKLPKRRAGPKGKHARTNDDDGDASE